MGGEAGGTGGIEGGVPPTVVDKSNLITPENSRKKPVKSEEQKKIEKEQKKKEKEQRAFDNKVAIKARQLWEEDGCPEDKGLYFDYIKRAEKIITESEEAKRKEDNARRKEANARRRKEREDRKERKEPVPRPDIPNAPPDQGGGGTGEQEDGQKGKESQEISDEMRLRKLIKRTEERYQISWDAMPLDLRLETERDILNNMKPKVTAPFTPETPNNLPVNMAEQESDLESIKRSIFERAGARKAEEVETLISQVEQILVQETAAGQGKLGRNIDETRTGINGQEYFVDGKIAYIPPKGDAVFIGDTHGDSQATESIVKQMNFIENMEKGDKSRTLVFLGDYADRGRNDARNLEIILALKQKYPDNVLLLKGNHEEYDVSMRDGLFDSMKQHFSANGERVFNKYHELFKKLPNVAVTGNGIVAVHGGVPEDRIDNLLTLKDNESLFEQIRWNDPSNYTDGIQPNVRGGNTKEFGHVPFEEFMTAIKGKVMIRGHQYPENGYELFFNDRLTTIFSNGGASRESRYSGSVMPKIMTASLVNPIDKITPQNLLDVKYS